MQILLKATFVWSENRENRNWEKENMRDFGWERKWRDFGGEKMVGSSPQKNGEKMRRRRG